MNLTETTVSEGKALNFLATTCLAVAMPACGCADSFQYLLLINSF